MKKYIYLQEGEIITPDVELHDPEGKFWEGNDYTDTTVQKNWVGHFRRPVPHTGDVQFLMAVSILVPVIVNCDGREQESIEAEAGELAYQKVLDDPQKYISYENVDWGNCKVDEIQPEPKSKYRMLTKHDIIEKSDEYLFPDGWKPVPMVMYGDQFNEECDNQSIRRPITEPQYRPFVEGDVIERGDQLRLDRYNDFSDIKTGPFPRKIDQSIIDSPDFRKLIK